ncbi:hypothetical protein [Psychrobacter lutiphocae]|uniref:hypothetical protein n=1 Tax=Psychrobacter lutiphocae TaxID=540500 RepID=UPI0003735721|nr:hypothetical protein [Psychrobacter lutiphocae]
MLSIQDISFDSHEDITEFSKSFDEFDLNNNFFDLTVYLTLGEGEVGSNYYFSLDSYYDSCTDSPIINNYEVYFRRKGEFSMKYFDKYILLDFINQLIANNSDGLGLSEQSKNLSKYFHWEFDNYVDL